MQMRPLPQEDVPSAEHRNARWYPDLCFRLLLASLLEKVRYAQRCLDHIRALLLRQRGNEVASHLGQQYDIGSLACQNCGSLTFTGGHQIDPSVSFFWRTKMTHWLWRLFVLGLIATIADRGADAVVSEKGA